MTFLFRGSSAESFVLSSPLASNIGITSNFIDTNYVTEGCVLCVNGTFFTGNFSSPQTEVWVHGSFWVGESSGNNGSSIFKLIDSGTGNPCVDLQIVNAATNPITFKLGQWNGASFTYSSTFNGNNFGTLFDYDAHIKIAVSGFIQLYIAGVLIYSFSGNTTAIGTSFSKILFDYLNGNKTYVGDATNNYFSQIIIGDSTSDTRGLKLVSQAANGAGTTSQWTGAYTTFTKTGIDDSIFCLDSTPNDISTFSIAPKIPSGWVPLEVSVSTRALLGTANTTNMQHVIRSGGTNYPGSNVTGNQSTFQPTSQTIWTTDPNGSIPWTRTSANAVEFGFKSIA